MMTPESKATTKTKTTTMAHTQKPAAASQSTSTVTSSSLQLSTLAKATKPGKSFVSNVNSNNNNNNNNNSSKKLAINITASSVDKMQMQMQQQQQQNSVTNSTKIKSENKTTKAAAAAAATNAFAQCTTKALLECSSNNNNNNNKNIKKEATPPANTTTTSAVDGARNSSSFASSCSSSSSSSSSSSAWSNIEDANSNGGASADEEPTSSEEAPAATTTTAAAAEAATTTADTTTTAATATSIMMTTPRPVLLTAVNAHIICHLCQGYLINATTIVECLHSFCHSCLINHLRKERFCPRCEMVINNAKPNIKSDTTLQAIVYKLVPGLYERELMRKRAFYKDRPQEAALATPEQRGDDTEHLIFSPSDHMSLSLEYAELGELNAESEVEFGDTLRPRYLHCPAMFRVSHLKKFVYDKFEIDAQRFSIDIMYKVKTIVLLDYYTLMDIAYIYTWKRDAPMRFYFRVYESPEPAVQPKAQQQLLPVVALKQEPAPSPVPASAPSPVVAPLPPLVVKSPTLSPPAPVPTPPQSPRIKLEQAQDEFRIAPKLNSPTDQSLKMVINRNPVEKHEKHHHHHHSPKSNGSSAKSLPSPTSSYNKEEPNIKLKIDLSKQNSVTIINMSDPERKEIVKPLKPEKESRSKSKKDKDGSPKSSSSSSSSSNNSSSSSHSPSSSSERKRKSPSPLTVPPLTIRTERILSPNGISTVLSPRVTSGACLEDPKSEFLKSFALTPIKVKVESPPEKHRSASSPVHPAAKSKSHLDDSLLMKPPSAMPPKSIASSKRKSKEPVKAVSKKPKLSPPLPREDFKIRLPAPSSAPTCASPPAPGADKPLMPPPIAKAPIAAARHKTQAQALLAPPAMPPAFHHQHHPHTPLHHQGMQMAAPGNRTPIAKRYQPILPKAARPNPFANIPSDVNRLLKDAGTEIKSIASQAKTHVYGPKSQEQKMGPPAAPPALHKPSNSNNNNSNNSSNNKANNYLNLALFNASKSKGKEAPPGCRTPMYTPNSPIYSPSSPQYVPNYNIPTMPTYKYTPKPTTTNNNSNNNSSTATTNSNYLQNMLNGSGSAASGGLFPTPPIKTDQNTNPAAVAAAAVAAAGEDAPEKQQVKVKSLLNSCNINIPSSLSITISRDNGDASSPSSGGHAKHKSPVNNYIEIVKLPDQPAAPESKESVKAPQPVKLPAPPSKTIPSPQHLLARMTPPQQLPTPAPTTTTVPPKTSPKAATPPLKSVLQPQQTEKKTPSPEKRPSSHSPNSSENKSPKAGQAAAATVGAASNNSSSSSSNGESAAKKFRPILPRQNAAPNGAELAPNKLSHVLPAAGHNFASSLAPVGKKVPASKKSPNNNAANNATASGKLALANGAAGQALPKSNQTPTKRQATGKQATPPPSSSNLTLAPTAAHRPNMNAPLSIASAANQLDLSNFLKENLMRAQVAQAAQAAQSNLLYNFAPAMYNYQQVYLMEQLSRMQRAGNEVFNDYLQKLKSAASAGGDAGEHKQQPVMPMLPTVTLPSPSQPAAAAASPKTSPHAAGAAGQGKPTPAATAPVKAGNGNGSGNNARPQAAATSNAMSLTKSK